ncbi:MAG: hypothetical protein BWY11_01568 [Firmicutes bacterium ADurb.Bin182]|nr:MAG: hypothetical protein BWY11_01568 [Firmicutes bacterium ADurb.Bin182]
MRKRVFVVIGGVLMFSVLSSSCMAKLTTIRPTLITIITVENIAAGEKAKLNRKVNEEVDWLMDGLVLQMEQFYKSVGRCDEADEHLYSVEFYMKDQLELSVFINSDGSVCKNGRRYVQKVNSRSVDRSVDLEQWGKCFDLESYN